jgi:predicted  nucleic acid-binding Zn-ribbon protein
MTKDTDRITDLEQRVQSLEATVTGLTEELVEANERIRALEGGENADAPTAIESTYPETDADTDDESETANTPKTAESRDSGEDTQEESDLDDIIVA